MRRYEIPCKVKLTAASAVPPLIMCLTALRGLDCPLVTERVYCTLAVPNDVLRIHQPKTKMYKQTGDEAFSVSKTNTLTSSHTSVSIHTVYAYLLNSHME